MRSHSGLANHSGQCAAAPGAHRRLESLFSPTAVLLAMNVGSQQRIWRPAEPNAMQRGPCRSRHLPVHSVLVSEFVVVIVESRLLRESLIWRKALPFLAQPRDQLSSGNGASLSHPRDSCTLRIEAGDAVGAIRRQFAGSAYTCGAVEPHRPHTHRSPHTRERRGGTRYARLRDPRPTVCGHEHDLTGSPGAAHFRYAHG